MKKLNLNTLVVESFSITDLPSELKGTVKAASQCSMSDYESTCTDATCERSCYGSCIDSCLDSCGGTCHYGNTCVYPCTGGGTQTGGTQTGGLETCNWGVWTCNSICDENTA